jgi:hypothetical protein
MEIDEDTLTESWQLSDTDEGWWWHLCVPFALEHGPFATREAAIEDLRRVPVADELAAAEDEEEADALRVRLIMELG